MSKDVPKFYKTRIVSPLIFILSSLLLGYCFPLEKSVPVILALFLITLLLVKSCIKIKIILVLVAIVLFAFYYDLRIDENVSWENKPLREVEVTLRVDRSFHYNKDTRFASGLATILSASPHLHYLVNQEVSYAINDIPAEANIKSARIAIKGLLKPVDKNSDNSFEQYLATLNIPFQIVSGRLISINQYPSKFYLYCSQAESYLESILNLHFLKNSDNASGVLIAMLLGNKAALTQSQKDAFKITGSLHLFAISGLHVGVIAATLAFLLKFFPIRRSTAGTLALLILFIYVQVTGGAPSAMRAFLMVAFYWGGRLLLRQKDAFSALLASAILVLLIDPSQLYNLGFQLSYTVVGAILLYGLPLNENLYRYLEAHYDAPNNKSFHYTKVILGFILSLLIVSLSANLVSIPLSMHYFGIFTPGALFLSLFLMPIASVVIVLGFISLIFGLVKFTWISMIINEIAYFFIRIMELSVNYAMELRCLFIHIQQPSFFWTISVMVMIFIGLVYGHYKNVLDKKRFYLLPVIFISICLFLPFTYS